MGKIDHIGDIPRILWNKDCVYQGTLIYYFNVIIRHATNLHNPYHNLRHMLHVFWLCHQACVEYQGRIDPLKMRLLLIAALCHDADHTGRAIDDSANIGQAVAFLDRYILDADRPYFEEICQLIRATESPRQPLRDTQANFLAKVLRDADLCQVLSSSWIQQTVIGLGQELGVGPLEMITQNTAFLRNLQFETTWARGLFPSDVIQAKLRETLDLFSIMLYHTGPDGGLL